MAAETHSQIANFIWSICNLLRGPYKRNEYHKVILPLTVLRRRHFYRYEPPRQLEVIETDIKRLEDDIMKMLKEITA